MAIESDHDVPFSIKRVYFIYDTRQEIERGFHAHRDLQQLMICTSGSCTVTLDDGSQRDNFKLDHPSSALFVDRMIWREMRDFADETVLLVLASRHYEPEDYIRSYPEFLKERQQFQLRS